MDNLLPANGVRKSQQGIPACGCEGRLAVETEKSLCQKKAQKTPGPPTVSCARCWRWQNSQFVLASDAILIVCLVRFCVFECLYVRPSIAVAQIYPIANKSYLQRRTGAERPQRGKKQIRYPLIDKQETKGDLPINH